MVVADNGIHALVTLLSVHSQILPSYSELFIPGQLIQDRACRIVMVAKSGVTPSFGLGLRFGDAGLI
jgi:hypothetical protein